MLAFRCKSCGRLHSSEFAGEAPHPHACTVCNSGIHYTDKPDEKKAQLKAQHPHHDFHSILFGGPIHKVIDPSNWEVLADATDERLVELGISRSEVEKHVPWTKEESLKRATQCIEVMATEGPGTTDHA